MMRNRLLLVSLKVLAVTFSAFAGAQAEQQQEAEGPVLVRLGLTTPEDTPEVQASRKFGEYLSEISGGAMTAETLAAGLAGGERDIVEAQQIGALEMSVVSGILQNFDPAMMILEYEFLFKNQDHVRTVMNGPIGEQIRDRLIERAGVRMLGVFQRSPRLLTTTRPIESVQDLAGLKIRVPEMRARVALWRAMGANPTPLAFPEVFTALQTGTIDGQENPISLIYGAKFYEVAPFLGLTNHVYGFMLLTIAEDYWQNLTPQQQGWIEEAAARAVEFNDELVAKSSDEYMAQVLPHVTVTEPDVSVWRERTKDVYRQFVDVEGFEDLYLQIVEAGEAFE